MANPHSIRIPEQVNALENRLALVSHSGTENTIFTSFGIPLMAAGVVLVAKNFNIEGPGPLIGAFPGVIAGYILARGATKLIQKYYKGKIKKVIRNANPHLENSYSVERYVQRYA